MKKNKTIFLTGGAEYVGSVLVKKLLQNNYKVIVLDTFWFAPTSIFDDYPNKKLLTIYKGDMRNYTLISDIFKNNNIDVVINLAAVSNDPCSELNPIITREINLDATINLIDTAKKWGVKRFITASSSSVYGVKKESEVKEDMKLEPITLYAKYKAEIEKYLKEKNDNNFTTVAIRSATVFGPSPRMRLDLTVNMLTAQAAETKK